MNQRKIALVLGATGGIGGEVAAELQRQGWAIRALSRRALGPNGAYEWVQGDCMNREDVVRAAKDASLIVHAVNPPGYKNWPQLVVPMLENTIAAAKQSGAQILFPGTLYNYGEGTAQPLTEETPQQPTSRKGALRVEMERKLEQASSQGTKVLIVRAGDFFGPQPGSSWFSQGMVQPGKPVSYIVYPGRAQTGHSWAYLPDLAKAMVQLMDKPRADFEVFNFAGHWDSDGTKMIDAVRKATGKPKLSVFRLPWIAIRALSPFVPFFAEMAEVRYLWLNPFELSNARLVERLGNEPRTPLTEAVRATLKGAGCLNQ